MAATYVKPGELGLNPEKLTEMLTDSGNPQYLSTV